MEARSADLFGSPILTSLWPEADALNPVLREAILAYEQQHPSTSLTNVGGWHSDPSMLEFMGAAGARLVAHINAVISEATRRLYVEFGRQPKPHDWTFSAWANINRHGDYNQMHTHPGATWSGVYYVDHGESDPTAEGTAIRLTDPNSARTNAFFPELSASDVTFKPEPGLMILFPSYVPHSVPPHRGDRPRISIAFNVRKEPFP